MSEITITREDGESGGRFVTRLDGHEAEMTYSRAGASRIIIDHTRVPDALGGKGIGTLLLRHAVETARRDGFAIIPLCPFVKAKMDKHEEWQDVLA